MKPTADTIKDDIDCVLGIGGQPRSAARLRDRLTKARDLIEYIQLHYVDVLEQDIEERKRLK